MDVLVNKKTGQLIYKPTNMELMDTLIETRFGSNPEYEMQFKSHGLVTPQVLEDMLKLASEKKYLQEIEFIYDTYHGEYGVVWEDVEGVGYGWAWLAVEKEFRAESTAVFEAECQKMLLGRLNGFVSGNFDNIYYINYFCPKENVESYHFVGIEEDDRCMEFTFSDSNEMF